MLEELRAKYVRLSMKLYIIVLDKWYNHIKRQHKTFMDNLSPEMKRQLEWKLKLEEK